jgi:hypothetical protein
MKKYTRIFTLATLMGTLILTVGCMSSEQKKKAAEAQVEVAQDNLEAKQENADEVYEKVATAEELKTFKLESELKIKNNEVSIAELKLKMNKQGSINDDVYVKKIDSLEIRNKNLKTRMGNYELTHSDWTKFKEEFNRDLDDLGFRVKELVKVDKKN